MASEIGEAISCYYLREWKHLGRCTVEGESPVDELQNKELGLRKVGRDTRNPV